MGEPERFSVEWCYREAQRIHSGWAMCPDCSIRAGGKFLCDEHARDAVSLLGAMHQDYSARYLTPTTEGEETPDE